ncbi:hypothetical protein A7K93_01720 [Candidatus Methylacidiphilum fumarolicum]|uniref:Uncharacterized protein n=2 Tax=Candidatus Methylacidiphilum fumarolicum TaxID=591154 RepID=I0JVR6_METFB|nr:hypothetical protein A7K93_01720 [Candidatus Methylacidiphilum fumarolicum]TFE76158.1 hypothetical protein A7K72_00455 [Candidatus Methylacidiphilum fumarolicum]CAI9086543.1 conserved protein of unknown function [Candidatus Methylacidiphilum fumarolicum]CCG91335.1 hypothetical protein MFUM_1020059 [Methylacidiphilum fumariolicum SolV]
MIFQWHSGRIMTDNKNKIRVSLIQEGMSINFLITTYQSVRINKSGSLEIGRENIQSISCKDFCKSAQGLF